MRKVIGWIMGAALLALLFYFFFFRGSSQKFNWKTQTVQRGDVSLVVTATGPVNPLKIVQVGTQVNGTIAHLYADFNSVVKKGQIIALIDTTLLSATKDDADANMDKSEFQLAEMKREYERAEKLFNTGVLPRLDYDVALTNYKSAQSLYDASKAQFTRAKINLKYATIHAPINGVVISRNVDVGQTVVSSFNTPTLFTIANDLSKMQVYANVDEADIGFIKVAQKAYFTVDAYPDDVFRGEIKQIRLQPSVVQNVVNYSVIIDVPNPDLKLLPGLTANISVSVKEHKDVLKIPSSALHFMPPSDYLEKDLTEDERKQLAEKMRQSKKVIWLKKENKLVPVEVQVGLSDGSFVEVEGDLKQNDEIVFAVEGKQDKAQAKSPFMPSFSRSIKGRK